MTRITYQNPFKFLVPTKSSIFFHSNLTQKLHSYTMQTSGKERFLRDIKVGELIRDQKRLIEVPYTASLSDTINTLTANRIGAVPVAAPPGHWIGAGGSMILESDKQTGAVRKHYIGMVTMLDVLAHIADVDDHGGEMERRMHVPVSTIIGHCIESLSLWTLSCNTSILDCMEVFSKGIHRALVPVDSHVENVSGAELMESASSYRMLTQTDVLKFLKGHEYELRGILSRQLKEFGAVGDSVFGVTNKTKVIVAVKAMSTAALNAVPVVESANDVKEDHGQLVNCKNRKLVGTLSATDLRGCPISQLQSCLHLNVVDYINKCSATSQHEAMSTKELVTCHPESTLKEAMDKCIDNHVHRVWVVDGAGLIAGLMSITDILRATRVWMLSEPV